jgi:hypothetical protein
LAIVVTAGGQKLIGCSTCATGYVARDFNL